MKVGIVGSRRYPAEHLVRGFVRNLAARAPDTIIVSGGARGVDAWAAGEARQMGLAVEEHLADWDGGGRGAGFARNSTIVACSASLVAFWDLVSRGTMDTVWKAHRKGIKVVVIGPDGNRVPMEAWNGGSQ